MLGFRPKPRALKTPKFIRIRYYNNIIENNLFIIEKKYIHILLIKVSEIYSLSLNLNLIHIFIRFHFQKIINIIFKYLDYRYNANLFQQLLSQLFVNPWIFLLFVANLKINKYLTLCELTQKNDISKTSLFSEKIFPKHSDRFWQIWDLDPWDQLKKQNHFNYSACQALGCPVGLCKKRRTAVGHIMKKGRGGRFGACQAQRGKTEGTPGSGAQSNVRFGITDKQLPKQDDADESLQRLNVQLQPPICCGRESSLQGSLRVLPQKKRGVLFVSQRDPLLPYAWLNKFVGKLPVVTYFPAPRRQMTISWHVFSFL